MKPMTPMLPQTQPPNRGVAGTPTPAPQTQPPNVISPSGLPRPVRSNVRADIMTAMKGSPFGVRRPLA